MKNNSITAAVATVTTGIALVLAAPAHGAAPGQITMAMDLGVNVSRSAAAVGSDGTLYFGGTDGFLNAVDPVKQQLKWVFHTGNNLDATPMVGDDGTIYAGSFDQTLYALNPNGTERWHFTTGGQLQNSGTLDFSGRLFLGSDDKRLYVLDARTGRSLWNLQLGGKVSAKPLCGPDGTIYIQTEGHQVSGVNLTEVIAINPVSRSSRWTLELGTGTYDTPAWGPNNTLYVARNDNVYAINAGSGAIKWVFQPDGAVNTSLVVGPDGTVYFGSKDDYLYAVSSAGKFRWRTKSDGHDLYSAPAVGADGNVYFGAGGYFYGLYATDGQIRWQTRKGSTYQVSDTLLTAAGLLHYGSANGLVYTVQAETTAPRMPGWNLGYGDLRRSGRVNPGVSEVTFLPCHREKDAIDLVFLGAPGATYQVQSTADYQSWSPVADVTSANGAFYLPAQKIGNGNAFFRAVRK